MDPVGPWSAYAASYNRLAGAAGGFQASPASGGGDFVTSHHHLAATGNTGLGGHQPPGGGVPSTTSQLLLQAAHTTATLAGQLGQLSAAAPGSTPSPFSPGGFLSPPSVGYDSVFSPLFHHANPKPAHYGSTLNVSQHRQALAQAQAAATKSNSVESELSSLRENYSTAHQSLAAASSNSFFEHQASPSSSLPWSHQGNSQLPSPFGVLPHETVVTSSPGSATTKSSSSYENTFNAHFVAAQSLNHINSQLTATSDFSKSSNYVDSASKKTTRSQSPHITPVKPVVSSSPVSGGTTFYNQTSSSAYANSESVASRVNCTPHTGNFSSKSQHITPASEYSSNTKSYTSSSSLPQQPSCIVSTTSASVSTKDYRVPQPSSRSSNTSVFLSSTGSRNPQSTEKSSPRNQNFVPPTSKAHHGIQTKAQTKIYPELGASDHHRRADNVHESSQSSPISFAMMDTSAHRQGLNYSGAPSTSSCGSGSNSTKLPAGSTHRNSSSNLPQAQQFQHVLTSQGTAVTAAPTSSSYPSRHYPTLTGSESSSDYHHGSRNVKSSSTADSSYSERLLNSNNTSSQSSPDCGVVVPRRPSPLQAHSQASPLSHVPSPGYPLYNSPIASMSSPSPLQLHSETTGNQCSNGSTRQHNGNPSSQQVTPPSPLDVSVPRASSQSSQVAYSSVITRALTTGEGSTKSFSSETRSQHQPQHQEFPQKQNCWDPGDRQVSSSRTSGKFTGSNASYSTSNNVGLEISQGPPQTHSGSHARATSNITERQAAYFDSSPSQVTLQDLSNCRGDPMTIVKNLQTMQHQPCQLQQPLSVSQPLKSDERSLNKPNSNAGSNNNSSSSSSSSNKRRKSGEKANSNVANSNPSTPTTEYYSGRVPPPAHHNTHSSNPQSQNGGYFDFERWNLPPPPPPKMFGGGTGAFSSQASLHHNTNFVNSSHQHPSLMVPNPHHSAPPIPYFPAFPLHAPGQPSNQHSSHEFQTSGNTTTVASSENQPSNENSGCVPPTIVDEHPKVIVPNIEEELGFLAEVNDTPVSTTVNNSNMSSSKPTYSTSGVCNTNTKMSEKKPFTYTNPASGFMASYMKFLQGERDSSPPQNKRGKSWAKTKLYQSPETSKVTTNTTVTTTSNSVVTTSTTTNVLSTSTSTLSSTTPIKSNGDNQVVGVKPKETPVYDPQDDPRYFPLKKERSGNFSDSDDDFNSSVIEKEKKTAILKVKEEKKEHEKEKEKSKDVLQEFSKDKKDKKEKNKLKPSPKTSKSSKIQANSNSKTISKSGTKSTDSHSDSSVCSSIEKSMANCASKSAVKIVVQDVTLPLTPLPNEVSKVAVNSEKASLDKGKKSSASKSSRSGGKKKRELEEEDLPRRETCRRKAKEKTLNNMKALGQEVLDEFDVDEPEFMDSDSDPAWTPAKDSSDDEMSSRRRTRRSSTLLINRKRARLTSTELTDEEGVSSSESQDKLSSQDRSRRQPKQKSASKGKGRVTRASVVNTTVTVTEQKNDSSAAPPSPPPGEASVPDTIVSSDIVTSATSSSKQDSSAKDSSVTRKEETSEFPFKSGEFVVIKSDMKEEYPPIWRIDGKTLLQKYEPFQENGKTLYRNISTYSGWTSENKHVYQQVPVKFRVQNRMETIVEFLRHELYSDDDIFEKSMKETIKYQDNFEVYIQTLISQALDSNFLPEILQEGDEYFLASVKKVDAVTEERKQSLLKVTKWKTSLVTSVGAWPCFNVISDLPDDEKQEKLCAACDKLTVAVRVQMYGQPYNSTTLEGCQPDPKVASEKDFLLCGTCLTRVELYHKVAHQKYLMYVECSQRVTEKRNSSQNDTTIILNELLANESWLNELFQKVRTSWAEIDKLVRQVVKSEQ